MFGAMICAKPVRFLQGSKKKQLVLYKHFNTDCFFWVHCNRNEVNIWHLVSDPINTLPIIITDQRELKNCYTIVDEDFPGESTNVTGYVIEQLRFIKNSTALSMFNIMSNYCDRKTLVDYMSICKTSRKAYSKSITENIICEIDFDMLNTIFNIWDVKTLGKLAACCKDIRRKVQEITGVGTQLIPIAKTRYHYKCLPDVISFKISVWGNLDYLVKKNVVDLIFPHLDFSDTMNLFSVNSKANLRMKLMRALPNTLTKLSMTNWNLSVTDPNSMSQFYPIVIYTPPVLETQQLQKSNTNYKTSNLQNVSYTLVTQTQIGESILYNGKIYYKQNVVTTEQTNKTYSAETKYKKNYSRRGYEDDYDYDYERYSY